MNNPYKDTEEKIMNHLAQAFVLFNKLEQTHPQHKSEFVDGIHKAQNTVMSRILQRDYPETFPTYKLKNNTSVNSEK